MGTSGFLDVFTDRLLQGVRRLEKRHITTKYSKYLSSKFAQIEVRYLGNRATATTLIIIDVNF